jgi:hypothetical protein
MVKKGKDHYTLW